MREGIAAQVPVCHGASWVRSGQTSFARAVSLRLTGRSPWMLESMCSRCAMSFPFVDGEFAALVRFGRARFSGCRASARDGDLVRVGPEPSQRLHQFLFFIGEV